MIWLEVIPGGKGRLYPKYGAEGRDVILEFDPKRIESLKEEMYHVSLGHHHELGTGLSYKRRWEMEKEVTELKLRTGEVNKAQAVMCLYNVRQGFIWEADEGRQIEGEDRRCLSWPSFLKQAAEMIGTDQEYVERCISRNLKN